MIRFTSWPSISNATMSDDSGSGVAIQTLWRRRPNGCRTGAAALMAHRIAPKAGTDLGEIWYCAAKDSGSIETVSRRAKLHRRRICDRVWQGGRRVSDSPSDMKVLIFGATGMVGQGVLRECLLDREIDAVCTVGRSVTGVEHAKLREVAHADLFHYAGIEALLRGFAACFFCLGVSAGGMPELAYERLTYGIALAAAETLARLNPDMTFAYVSGAGTDNSEKGRTMWARVKGKTENAILRLPFKAAYMFRPAGIAPMHGERSKTPAYRIAYALTKPLFPLLRRLFPSYITTTEEVGLAMIYVAKQGAPKRILENLDIRECAWAAMAERA